MKTMKTTLRHLLGAIAVSCISFFGMSQDPGISGSIPFTKQSYDLGDEAWTPPSFPVPVEVIGSVHHPTDLSGGPYPVLVFLHGRHSSCYSGSSSTLDWPCDGGWTSIPSYDGYDYLAEHFASLGYIVISISANSISNTDNSVADYGMQARGELVQYHLDLWNDWNTTGGGPWSGAFVGALDLTNIGTMGHSRGGEGVIMHALYNESLGSPYGVNAVLTLAPVDFNRPVLKGTPVMNIAPYCDGDVSDLQGVHFYDDVRYGDLDDDAPKYNLLMMGANHNYYNTVWTPGMFPAGTADDWQWVNPSQSDSHCGTSSGTDNRYDAPTQRAAFQAYSSAFFRTHVGGETAFEDILQVDDVDPPASSLVTIDDIYMSYHPPVKQRVDLNRQDAEDVEVTNTQGEAVTEVGLVEYDICGDDFGEQYCLSAGTAQEPHNKNGGVAILGAAQLELEWNNTTDTYTNAIPSFMQDFNDFEAVQFRCAVNFEDSPSGSALDFRVELEDGSGATSSLLVSDYSNALFFPPGGTGSTVPRTMQNTIKVPITDFAGIDLTDIAFVRFTFTEMATGAILISDLIMSAETELVYPPVAAFSANVTTTCTGEVTFSDDSDFFPDTWSWDFGDGETSTEENPTHTYEEDGTYTVTLTVSNPAGGDSYTETSYIVVDKPDAPTVEDDVVCEPGEVTLTATPLSGGILNWYDAPVGGTLVNTGTSYTTSISATTSYWVEEVVEQPTMSVGPADNSFGGGGYFTANDLRGIFFDALSEFILESVYVYSGETATRTIQVLDGEGGDVVLTGDYLIPAGESIVELDWTIPPGEQYYIKVTGLPVNLYRNNSGPSYPYTAPGIVSLTGSNVAGAETDYYYFFYDWQIREADCLSERAEVMGVIDPSLIVEANASATEICEGEEVTLTGSGGSGGYAWSGGVEDGVPFTPSTTDTYTVSSSGSCGGTADITVVVNPLPTVTTSADVTIAAGETTPLSATGGGTYSWSPTTGLDDPTSATPNASPVTTTTYTVTVTDGNSCENTSEVTVTIDGHVGIGEQTGQFLTIHPNPSNGVVNIVSNDLTYPYTVEIYSAEGKLVYKKEIGAYSETERIDLSKEAKGNYILKATNKDFSFEKKIILE